MGLDQYAYSIPKDEANLAIDQKAGFPVEPFHVWRKHPNLHGWMERLFRKRGGEGVFNCRTVRLTIEDLDELEKEVRAYKLPFTTGFFFGESHEENYEDDLMFIMRARMEIQNEKDVYYDSWW